MRRLSEYHLDILRAHARLFHIIYSRNRYHSVISIEQKKKKKTLPFQITVRDFSCRNIPLRKKCRQFVQPQKSSTFTYDSS